MEKPKRKNAGAVGGGGREKSGERIRNNAYRLHYPSLPSSPRGFRATFIDALSPLSWSLEQH